MKLYHATLSRNVPAIMRDGLQPQANGRDIDPVHLSERDMSEFIYGLFGLQPGGFFEHENGYVETVTLLEVDVTGLGLESPGWDGEDHHMSRQNITPDRIKVLVREQSFA